MARTFDVLVIGAGIAGASAAWRLADGARVGVLERESMPGYHTTGRSAAFFTEAYGNDVVRALARASRAFLENPPEPFESPLMEVGGGVMFIAREDQGEVFERELAHASAIDPSIIEVTSEEAREIVPALDPRYLARAFREPAAMGMDVDRIHQGFLRGLRARGGEVIREAEVLRLERKGSSWRVETHAGAFSAPVVINAAGAWCDVIGEAAGCRPIGLEPKRRTAIVFDVPAAISVGGWPITIDIEEKFYFRPDAGRILASPADETPSPPCDAQPEEIDVALTVDRIERATTLCIGKVRNKWAGLRSFVADRTPVVGKDPEREGFYWLAGQGGYGIMTAPAMSGALAALVRGDSWPASLSEMGVESGALDAGRSALVSM